MITLTLTREEMRALRYAVAKGLEGLNRAQSAAASDKVRKHLSDHHQALVNVDQQMKGAVE